MGISISGGIIPFSVKRRVALMGDSITDLNGGPRLDGSFQNYNPNGYWTWASIFTKHNFQLVMNSGIPGDGTANMASRFAADIKVYTPDLVVVFGGINDILAITGSGNRESVVSAIKTSLGSMYDQCAAIGSIAIAIPTLPVSASWNSTGLSSDQKLAQGEVNAWIRQQAATRKNVIIADGGSSFVDPATIWLPLTTGATLQDYTADGLHPAATGAILIGWLIAKALAPFVAPGNVLAGGNGDSVNLLSNGALIGSISNAAPTGWTLAIVSGGGTCAVDYVDRDDGISGQWMRLTLSGSCQIALGQVINGGFETGDLVKASIEFLNDSIDGTLARAIVLQLSSNEPSSTVIQRMTEAGFDNPLTGQGLVFNTFSLRSGVLETPPVTVTSGTGYLNFNMFVFGDGVYRIGSATVVKIQ